MDCKLWLFAIALCSLWPAGPCILLLGIYNLAFFVALRDVFMNLAYIARKVGTRRSLLLGTMCGPVVIIEMCIGEAVVKSSFWQDIRNQFLWLDCREFALQAEGFVEYFE